MSSQYISALLMIGPVIRKGLELELTGQVISRPYIDLTLKLMKDFGAQEMCIRDSYSTARFILNNGIPLFIGI